LLRQFVIFQLLKVYSNNRHHSTESFNSSLTSNINN